MAIFSILKKRFLLISIVLFLIVVGGAGLVLLNLGKVVNSNKDRILAKAEEVLGRKVSIEKIDVTVWSGVAIHLSQFSVADDPNFSQEKFVGAETLDIYFKLLPLFRKQLEISHLTLQKPLIKIVKNKKGEFNFSSLIAKKSSDQDESTEPTEKTSSPASLALARLEVKDGRVQFVNQASDMDLSIDQIDATVRDFSLDKPFPVQVDSAFLDVKRNVSFSGTIGPISAAPISLSGDVKLKSLSMKTLIQFPATKSSLPATIKTGGSMDGSVHLDGNLENLKIAANLDGSNVSFIYGEKYEKPKGMPLLIDTQSTYTGKAVTIEKAHVKLAEIELDGQGNIVLGDKPNYDFSLISKPIDIAWAASLALEYKEYDPKGKASLQASGDQKAIKGALTLDNVSAQIPGLVKPITDLKGNVNFTLKQANTDGLTFQLGSSKLQANSEITSFSPIAAKFNLSSEKLNVADVIQPSQAMKNDAIENLRVLGNLGYKDALSAKGSASSNQGTLYGLPYTHLKSPFQMDNKVVTMNDLSFQTLKGVIEGKMKYDMQKDPPAFDISTQAKSVDLAEVVRSKLGWLPDFIQGKVNLNMDLAGNGTNWDAIKPSLQGNGALEIDDGMLLNVNIAESVLNGMTGMPGLTNFVTANYKQEYPRVFASEHTVFEILKLDTAIKDGKIDFKNLLISASDWAINGEGWMDFGSQLKSDALLRLSKDFTSFLTGKVDVFKYLTDNSGNMAIPFSMTGVLPTLKPQPNADFIGGILQKAVAGQVMDKLNLKGLPGFSNLLPFNVGNKPNQNLPEIPADKAVASPQATEATRGTSVPRTIRPATAAIKKATEIKPTDLINPFLRLLDKK